MSMPADFWGGGATEGATTTTTKGVKLQESADGPLCVHACRFLMSRITICLAIPKIPHLCCISHAIPLRCMVSDAELALNFELFDAVRTFNLLFWITDRSIPIAETGIISKNREGAREDARESIPQRQFGDYRAPAAQKWKRIKWRIKCCQMWETIMPEPMPLAAEIDQPRSSTCNKYKLQTTKFHIP
ncbi:hypothetical protein C8R44DRAFT_752368 [Mycena epipterygia]|nr:hypothetical protein C8R44DRAFT_752368 [Mycena epipterygia]